jgi:unsaturated rhamnogalacturonyl hydrolase
MALRRTGLSLLLTLGPAALVMASESGTAPAPPPPRTAPLSVQLADSVLARWPDPLAISAKGWEYTPGIVLRGIAEVYRVQRDPRYLAYVKRWVDAHISPDGRIDFGDDEGGHNLDRFQPGILLFLLQEETGEGRYRKAAMGLRARFDSFPRNRSGGFWHKKKYPNQMWLDGLYMAEPFLVRYGKVFGEPAYCYDTAVRQILLAAEHTRAGSAGLFRHAWDEEKAAPWADPATGVSLEVWGRASGWFLMALVDVLEDLPPSHPGHPLLVALFREAARGVVATQDASSGLWYQVMDKGDRPENWLETSASGMFVYALRRGVAAGLLDTKADRAARKGWDALVARLEKESSGRIVVRGSVEGMSVQKDYGAYVARRRLDDSPHGLCALLLASAAMEYPAPRSR